MWHCHSPESHDSASSQLKFKLENGLELYVDLNATFDWKVKKLLVTNKNKCL